MKSELILIVEDSLTQLEQLKYLLEKNDYQVISARNGKIAYDMVLNDKPDLVISDIVMPEMGGYDLCYKIKQNNDLKDIPVILLTGLSDPKDVILGLKSGADNFLTKPYTEKLILSRIQYVLINQEFRQSSVDLNMGFSLVFDDEKYFINSDKLQIIDLLLSTYENAVNKNNELKEVNDKLMEMHSEILLKNEELEKLNHDKNLFLGIAAHDLRNPIGFISSAASLLLENDPSSKENENTELLHSIKKSSEQMLLLLNDLLDISVLESGKMVLKKSTNDLVDLIRNNIKENSPFAEKKKIRMEFDTQIEIAEIEIDQIKIEQVLSNLLSNAIKFSNRSTNIKIVLSSNEEEYKISVKDQGLGIPEDELKNLFVPFSDISVKSTAGEKNTGLGLSIVHKIITKHGGRIWVESEPNKGSTFYFTLPKIHSSE